MPMPWWRWEMCLGRKTKYDAEPSSYWVYNQCMQIGVCSSKGSCRLRFPQWHDFPPIMLMMQLTWLNHNSLFMFYLLKLIGHIMLSHVAISSWLEKQFLCLNIVYGVRKWGVASILPPYVTSIFPTLWFKRRVETIWTSSCSNYLLLHQLFALQLPAF